MNRAKQAERVVARHGVTAWLVVFAAGIMSFLLLYTVALGALANGMAKSWENALLRSATVRIVAPAQDLAEISPVVEEVLATTPGVAGFDEITSDAQLKLLAPWLGDELPENVLSLPKLYSVDLDQSTFDETALTARLKAEAPAAIWDNHNRWQGPLLVSAKQIRTISWLSSGLIAMTFLGLIFITSEATIASNAQSIILLRRIGARDRWIQSGFVRKFATRSLIGSLIGVGTGYFVVNRILAGVASNGTVIEAGKLGGQMVSALMIVIGAVLFTVIATLWATDRYLKRTE